MIASVPKNYIRDASGKDSDNVNYAWLIVEIVTPYVLADIKKPNVRVEQKQDLEKASECIRYVY